MKIRDNITFKDLDNCYTIFIELQSRNGGEVGSCIATNRMIDRLHDIAIKNNFKFDILYISSADTRNYIKNYDNLLSLRDKESTLSNEDIKELGLYEAKTDYIIDTDKKVIGFKEAIIMIIGENPYCYFKFEEGLHRNIYSGEFTCNGGNYIGTTEVSIYPLPDNQKLYTLDKNKIIIEVIDTNLKKYFFLPILKINFEYEDFRIDGCAPEGRSLYMYDYLIAKVFKSKFYLQQKEALNKSIERLQQNQGYRYVTYNYNLDIIENSAKICSYKKDTIQDHRTNKEYSFAQINERLLDLYEEYKYIYE